MCFYGKEGIMKPVPYRIGILLRRLSMDFARSAAKYAEYTAEAADAAGFSAKNKIIEYAIKILKKGE
jgi:hypothetical protein